MNREQKRKFKKQLNAKGYSKTDVENILKTREAYENREYLQEGQKVKLNLDQMKSHPDWNKSLDANKTRHHDWVELHKDDIFTVEYDDAYKEKPTLVCLKEDTTCPKWLFWEGDLEVIKE